MGDLGSVPGSGRFPGEGNGDPPQDSCLKIPGERAAWWATVHGSHRVGHDWASDAFTFTAIQQVPEPPCRAQPSLPPPRPTLPPLSEGRSQELACWTSLVAWQMKNLPASTGTQVRSLGREDAACSGAPQAHGPGARALRPEQPRGERPERHSEESPTHRNQTVRARQRRPGAANSKSISSQKTKQKGLGCCSL